MKKKKILKILAIFLVISIGVIVAIPIIFEDKIIGIIKDTINDNVNAKLDFEDADVSLLSSFPNATITIEDATLINFAPFEGDTLFTANKITLKMSVRELFKNKSEAINVNYFALNSAKVSIHINTSGDANYDIAKPSAKQDKQSETKNNQNFIFSVKKYELTDSELIYKDDSSKTDMKISNLNHAGAGDLSLDNAELDTKTAALVSLELDSVNYLNKNQLKLDALIGIDLKNNKYSFLKNEAIINQLPIVFDGFVQLNENNQEVNISFETPSSDFKNFLAVIPEVYSKNIENVKTAGNFELKGEIKGVVDATHIPTFNISIASENAMFKYPDLPKSVQNIEIQTTIVNKTGISNDTYINIERLSFKIDEDVFNASAKMSNLIENPYVNATINGRLNLAKLSEVYPMPVETALKGRLDANVTTSFDMNSLEKKRYGQTKNKGNLKLSDFEYDSEEVANPIKITTAEIAFNPSIVSLKTFDAKTGKTDFKANGTINNLLGFLFNDENIEGNFNLDSDVFSVSDFMVKTSENDQNEEPEKMEEQIKIPSFLDATLNASANTVLYDNLTLKNVKGTLIIKDEKASLVNVTSNLFEGNLGLNGSVSTKTDTPVFDMNLVIDAFDIAQSFNGLELFQTLSPIAKAIEGKLNTTLSLSGNLNNDFTPNLSTINGNALAELLASSIDPKKSNTLNLLSNNLSFIDLKQLNLNKLKTSLSFENGKVQLKPFQLKYKDIAIAVSGSHSFNKSLNYQATFDVPAKYLGDEVAGLIAKLNEDDTENITVPITANISGNAGNPKINTDIKQAITNVTSQLVAKQKEKLVGKGKDKVKDVVGNFLANKKTVRDSTSNDTVTKDAVKETANKLINNLFKKKKKKKDSTQN